MEQIRRTTDEALEVLELVLSSIDHGERARLGAVERVVLMKRARRLQDRVTSLACVLTDEVAVASVDGGHGNTHHVVDWVGGGLRQQ